MDELALITDSSESLVDMLPDTPLTMGGLSLKFKISFKYITILCPKLHAYQYYHTNALTQQSNKSIQ